ncbi:DUF4304 domain-containing protein [Neobacillus terrae]|uniref:DUF4304 domain-containing protein n=1 Tax=Neobacillus terrae TaxID=3034837 RepID=UPI00140A254E|nr:DUF4304 domain-containing protein [Neobacillus terrae]NHM33830.1 DUF4304 domain-containing protein [Neobacillus terrae]
MASERDNMISAIKKIVVPELRKRGFKGSIPNFRRISQKNIDLMTFQFDRYSGGFVIEVGLCSPEGFPHYWGEKVPANSVTAHDLHPDNRLRLKDSNGQWFRYDVENGSGDIYGKVAIDVLRHLYEAEDYREN